MSNVYHEVFAGITDGIFESAKIIVKLVTRVTGTTSIIEHKLYAQTDKQNYTDREAIKSDFAKVGKDLFGALNNYEREKGLKLSNR